MYLKNLKGIEFGAVDGWTTIPPGLESANTCWWFVGYRFGKNGVHGPNKPELILVEVWKISNGITLVAKGNFIETHRMEGYWQQASLPLLPFDLMGGAEENTV